MKENTAAILAISFLVQLVGIASTTVKSKVLILGGGPAGLGFANRLHEQGENDFLVLEAHSFLGGRVKDIKFGNMTIQEGANWIHDIGDANSIYKLKQKYGLATTPDNYTDFIVRYEFCIYHCSDIQNTLINAIFQLAIRLCFLTTMNRRNDTLIAGHFMSMRSSPFTHHFRFH